MNENARKEPIALVIPQPASRQVSAVAAMVFFFAPFAYGLYKFGLERSFALLVHHAAAWLLIFVMSFAVVLLARLAFPPRSSLPWLEVSLNHIRVVPGRIARLSGDAPVEISFTPQSKEILLFHSVWLGLGDGFRLIIRAADGTENQIRATSMDYLTARDAQKLADGISAATGLPVRCLTRRQQKDETVQEAPWNPPTRRVRMVRIAALAMAFVPFAGGIVVGVLWPTPGAIVAIGLALWLGQMVLSFMLSRFVGSRAKFPSPYSLVSVFTFGALYAFAVVVVGFIFMRR